MNRLDAMGTSIDAVLQKYGEMIYDITMDSNCKYWCILNHGYICTLTNSRYIPFKRMRRLYKVLAAVKSIESSQ